MSPKAALRSINDLQPDPGNPRTITEEAAEGLSFSLAEFGDLSGIVWNARTGTLITGHQRLARLKADHGDNLQLARGIIKTPDGRSFKVRKVDWAEDKARAAMVAANHDGIQGQWTEDLPEVLQSIELQLPDSFVALNLGEMGDGEEISTGSTGPKETSPDPDPSDPDKALAETIASTQETLDATTTVSRIVGRLEAALHRRAEVDPAGLNRALMIIVPLGKSAETVVLADPALSDGIAELRRAYDQGEETPVEQLLARAFSFT